MSWHLTSWYYIFDYANIHICTQLQPTANKSLLRHAASVTWCMLLTWEIDCGLWSAVIATNKHDMLCRRAKLLCGLIGCSGKEWLQQRIENAVNTPLLPENRWGFFKAPRSVSIPPCFKESPPVFRQGRRQYLEDMIPSSPRTYRLLRFVMW